MSPNIPNLKLSNGKSMPIHGLGTWQSAPGVVETATETAIDAGYKLIDTALVYGNEKEIGNALTKKIKEGVVKREDIFITTKNWVTFYRREQVTESLKKSLAALQTNYVDLYLLHAPCSMETSEKAPGFKQIDVDLMESWKGMEDVYNAGLAKAIGISNFNAEQIQRICDKGSVKPHNLQIELHIYYPQAELRELCKKLDISVTSYATLGSPGRLTFMPEFVNWPNPGVTMEDPKVLAIAKAHNKSPAQVLLRWAVQHDVAVIPKSGNPDRIKQNVDIFDFELSAEEMTSLDHSEIHQRLFLQEWCKGHKEDPFASER